MISDRLQAIWKLQMPEVRELAGLHRFDGQVQDLSPSGVAAMLAQLGRGEPEANPHDEAQLSAVEAGMRTAFATAEIHRWNPLVHLSNLDVACYDREYASAERARGRQGCPPRPMARRRRRGHRVPRLSARPSGNGTPVARPGSRNGARDC